MKNNKMFERKKKESEKRWNVSETENNEFSKHK